jgi:hypothetical protein
MEPVRLAQGVHSIVKHIPHPLHVEEATPEATSSFEVIGDGSQLCSHEIEYEILEIIARCKTKQYNIK